MKIISIWIYIFASSIAKFAANSITNDSVGCENFGLGNQFQRNTHPAYDLDFKERGELLWQHEVYNRAANIALNNNRSWIIDAGCGNGLKAFRLYRRGFKVYALDMGDNARAAQSRFTNANQNRSRVLETDLLNSTWAKEVPDNIVLDAVLVSADVIEHMLDPSKFIAAIKLLLSRGLIAVVISTPDTSTPSLQDYFWRDHPLGPPPRSSDVQIWNTTSFVRFLVCQGIPQSSIEFGGRKNNPSDDSITGVMVTIHSQASRKSQIGNSFRIEDNI